MPFKYITITWPQSDYYQQVLRVQEVRPDGVVANDIFIPVGHFKWQ